MRNKNVFPTTKSLVHAAYPKNKLYCRRLKLDFHLFMEMG